MNLEARERCDGIRLIVQALKRTVVEAIVLTGWRYGISTLEVLIIRYD